MSNAQEAFAMTAVLFGLSFAGIFLFWLPRPGESRADVADIFLHVHNRLVEIVAGTEGERLFLPGKPWFATDDERQAVAYGSLITASPESAAALVGFARVEAAALLRPREHIIRALADALRTRRTLTGAEVDMVISEAVATRAGHDEQQRRTAWRRAEASARAFQRRCRPPNVLGS